MSGIGLRGHAMLMFQNSYGTALTTSLTAVPFRSEGIVKEIAQLRESGMYGRLSESPYREGAHAIRGSLECDAFPQALGHFLKGSLGSLVTTSAAGIQTHVVTALAADFDDRAAVRPLTIEVNRDVESSALYSDMLVNQLTLNVAHNELLSFTAELLGGNQAKLAPSTPAFPIESPFQWDQTSISYNGVGVRDVRRLTLMFNNNLDLYYTLTSSKTPFRIKRTRAQEFRASGQMTFVTHSYWDAFLNQSVARFFANFVGNEAPNTLLWDLPGLRITRFAPMLNAEGIVEAAFDAVGTYLPASAEAGRITLVNSKSYY